MSVAFVRELKRGQVALVLHRHCQIRIYRGIFIMTYLS